MIKVWIAGKRHYDKVYVSPRSFYQTLTAGGEDRGSAEPIEDELEGDEKEGEETGDDREKLDSKSVDEGDEHDQLEQQDDTQEDGEPVSKPETQQAQFVSSDVFSAVSRHKHGTLVPYGLPCVRELLRFLVSIINMRERWPVIDIYRM